MNIWFRIHQSQLFLNFNQIFRFNSSIPPNIVFLLDSVQKITALLHSFSQILKKRFLDFLHDLLQSILNGQIHFINKFIERDWSILLKSHNCIRSSISSYLNSKLKAAMPCLNSLEDICPSPSASKSAKALLILNH